MSMLRVTMLFWEESEEEQAAIGSFVLRGRTIAIEPVTPDANEVLGRILARDMRTEDGGYVSPTIDPEGWMRALPRNYDGAQVRAELEES